jgi:hypothetical protein
MPVTVYNTDAGAITARGGRKPNQAYRQRRGPKTRASDAFAAILNYQVQIVWLILSVLTARSACQTFPDRKAFGGFYPRDFALRLYGKSAYSGGAGGL